MAKLSAWRRGYGAEHRRLRALIAPEVEAGNAACWRCGNPILPRQAFDLGHHDVDRSKYMGPEHALARDCPAGGNRAARRLDRRDPAPRSDRWWQAG